MIWRRKSRIYEVEELSASGKDKKGRGRRDEKTRSGERTFSTWKSPKFCRCTNLSALNLPPRMNPCTTRVPFPSSASLSSTQPKGPSLTTQARPARHETSLGVPSQR